MISADLKLGGFGGEIGEASAKVQRKRALLASEGVVFESDFRVSRDSLHSFGRTAEAKPSKARAHKKRKITHKHGKE